MPKRNLVLILVILALAAGVVFFNRNHVTYVVTNNASQPTPTQKQLAEVARTVQKEYIRPVREEQIVRGAIRGMVEELDEFSRYVPPGQQARFNTRMSGSYRGTGLKVEIIEGRVVVIGAMLGSPADRAGFRTGDCLVSVDKEELAGLPLSVVYELLDEGQASGVQVSFLRAGQTYRREVARAEMDVETVVGLFRNAQGRWVYLLDGKEGTAYVRVREFCPRTPEHLLQVLRELGNLRSLVLDLRDNPGGGLPAAVGAANLFIHKGVIVKSIDRAGRCEIYSARADRVFSETIPVVVLVNRRTASAAEIVAGALWVHGRAALVGERTRGKGCVQTLFPLGDDLGQISLTTSEYLLEGDMRISRQGRPGGLAPDVPVWTSREADLDAMRLRGDVLYLPTPETMPVGWPRAGRDLLPMLLAMDEPLVAATKLLRTPAEYRGLLEKATEARAAAPASRPATGKSDHE